jgi:hypothetical protein
VEEGGVEGEGGVGVGGVFAGVRGVGGSEEEEEGGEEVGRRHCGWSMMRMGEARGYVYGTGG